MAESEVESLRARLAELEARQKLNDATDEALELAQRDRLPLNDAIESLLPLIVTHTGATRAWIRTFDENLELREFTYGGRPGDFPLDTETIVEVTNRGERVQRRVAGKHVIAQPLDVAGELFGAAALAFESDVPPKRLALSFALLNTWCEELDNYLAAIALMRRKHRITNQLSEALRAPIIDDGVQEAIAVLRAHVSFDDMLLVFRHHEDSRGASLHYVIIQDGTTTHDSRHPDMEIDEFVREHASSLLKGESRALFDRFGIDRGREEVLISGVRNRHTVGRVVVTTARGEFNTFDRDLLERFADFLRQRVVDFTREWKGLSLTFAPDITRRLLTYEDYRERFLAPRVVDAAILFADISGFTRISEQVLQTPERVGELIDGWSERVVGLIWETGGVFDKMVGDCVIAFWGPPFDDYDPVECCRRASSAARLIRDYTNTLNDGNLLPELKGIDPPVGVAIGVNYASVCVGIFGPDEEYTGFSSGMNNTARLQGVATRDEILCMESFCRTYDMDEAFGELRQAEVKNVAQPLKFRALR